MEKSPLQKVREYFEFESLAQFRKEWNELTESEKEWFKSEVSKIVD